MDGNVINKGGNGPELCHCLESGIINFFEAISFPHLRYSKNVHDTKHEVPLLVLGVWSECEDCNSEPSSPSRSVNTLGPARRVAEKPFLIVTGKGSLHLFLNL